MASGLGILVAELPDLSSGLAVSGLGTHTFQDIALWDVGSKVRGLKKEVLTL